MSQPPAPQAPSHSEHHAAAQPVGYWKFEAQGWVFYHAATEAAYWRELPPAPDFNTYQTAEEYAYAQQLEIIEDNQNGN